MSVKISLNRYFICTNHKAPPLASVSPLCSYGSGDWDLNYPALEIRALLLGSVASCEMKGSGAEEAKKKKKKIKMFFCLGGG